MSTDSERDHMTDRILRSAIRPDGAAADGEACVDAETLAAWSDGALPVAEAAAVEAHLADCARCQAVLAAFAESEPVATVASGAAPVVVPFRARSVGKTMRWLIPAAAGTIAATLLVWTAWPKPNATVAVPDTTMASRQTTEREKPEGLAFESQLSKAAPAPATADARADQKMAAARRDRAGVAEERAISPTQVPTTVPVQAAPPPAAPVLLPQRQSDPTMAGRQTQVAAGAAVSRDEFIVLDGAAKLAKAELPVGPGARVIAEFAPADPPQPGVAQGFGGAGRGGGATSAASAANRTVPRIRWRVHASGAVTKSTDAGENWQPVTIVPPAVILNGASPMPNVCWLIGRAGIVMRSIDGVKFMRVTAPDIADLRSIKAVDAREASVTTMDGRVFTTMDGGETWHSGV